MTAGMAEVIAAHKYEFLPLVCGCGVVCGADEDELTYAAHVAEELAKAGYGTVQTAQVEAWSEGWAAGLLDASIPGRKESTNPYSEPQHG